MTLPPLNLEYYNIHAHTLPTLLTAIAILSLGLIILVHERHARVSLSFFIMTGTAGIWLLGYSLMYGAETENEALRWAMVGHLGITLIPASVYHFTVKILQVGAVYKKRVWLAWLLGCAFLLTIISTDVFISGLYRYSWGYYPRYGWLSFGFLAFFFFLMALSLRHYWAAYCAATEPTSKQRSRALLIAFSVAYLASVDYLPALGIELYPMGYLAILGFVALTARATWRYRLVDITPAFAAHQIINAMADALLVLDHRGVVRVANRAACRMFNRAESELIGTPVQSLSQLLAPPEAQLDRLILSGFLHDLETNLPAPRPDMTVVSTSSYAMRDSEQRPVAFVCIIRNVTQQKNAQRAKDEFLSVMSHELRTPLNVIAGYTKIVQEGMLGPIAPEQVRALEKVSRHSNELLAMVNSIMDATKIEAGAIVVETDEFPLSNFLDALRLLYEYPLGKPVSLRWEYPRNLPTLRTDREKLKRVLQNLINNALKFTEQGHVTVSACRQAGTSRIEIAVADSGVGIAAEDLPLIFEKFRQLDGSRTRTQGGVGLGLHIVKTFTEILGGTVTVQSRPGTGSVFTVTLPCVHEARDPRVESCEVE